MIRETVMSTCTYESVQAVPRTLDNIINIFDTYMLDYFFKIESCIRYAKILKMPDDKYLLKSH